MVTLIDVFVLAGMGVVVPAACPALRARWWAASVALLLPALLLPQGLGAALLAIPALGGSVLLANRAVVGARRGPDGSSSAAAGELAIAALLGVAAGAAVAHAHGGPVLGIHDPIIELTAVHFTFAGVGAFRLALTARQRTAGGARHLAGAAVVLSVGAPPVVALGFLSREALPQVGGAVLMTLAVWATAVAQLTALPGGSARWCLVASSAAVALAMPLAVAWAAGQHWDVPALSVQAMVRTHGMLNGLVFVPAGLLGWHLAGTRPAGRSGLAQPRERTG